MVHIGGGTVVQWLAPLPHTKRVLGSNPPCGVCMLSSCLHGFSPGTVPIGVSVSGCLSPYVSPATDWQPVQGVPHSPPNDSGDRLQHPPQPC